MIHDKMSKLHVLISEVTPCHKCLTNVGPVVMGYDAVMFAVMNVHRLELINTIVLYLQHGEVPSVLVKH